jgi:hypothetical protein
MWLGDICSDPLLQLGAPSAAETNLLRNALIESFAVHARNVIDFLYPNKPQHTDVIAADFYAPGAWAAHRPGISTTLTAARRRAHKEIAHLTTERIAGNPPEKDWDFAGLTAELRPLMQLFATNALPARCSPAVARLFADHKAVTPP